MKKNKPHSVWEIVKAGLLLWFFFLFSVALVIFFTVGKELFFENWTFLIPLSIVLLILMTFTFTFIYRANSDKTFLLNLLNFQRQFDLFFWVKTPKHAKIIMVIGAIIVVKILIEYLFFPSFSHSQLLIGLVIVFAGFRQLSLLDAIKRAKKL